MWGKETQMFHFLAAFSSSGTYVFLIFLPSMLKGGSRSSTGNGHHCFSWAATSAPTARSMPARARHETRFRRDLIRFLLVIDPSLSPRASSGRRWPLADGRSPTRPGGGRPRPRGRPIHRHRLLLPHESSARPSSERRRRVDPEERRQVGAGVAPRVEGAALEVHAVARTEAVPLAAGERDLEPAGEDVDELLALVRVLALAAGL